MGTNPLLQPQKKKTAVATIPPQVKSQLEPFVNWLISIEEKYYDSTLQPFAQHAKQMKAKADEFFEGRYNELIDGQKMLKEQFAQQEAHKEKFPPESSYSTFEEAVIKIFDPLDLVGEGKTYQEEMKLPQPFMDRAYAIGRQLYDEKKYSESLAAFRFLRLLNPTVPEYWFAEAGALQANGKFEEAIDAYTMSVLAEPNNPLPFFHMAGCYSSLGDKESTLQALEFCCEYAKENDAHAALFQRATQIKEALQPKQSH